MALSDELDRLDGLRQRGVLSEEEFARAKARLLSGEPVGMFGPGPATAGSTGGGINALRRSLSDRWLGGVCGGIARMTGVESWVWRLVFALLFLFGGVGGLAYVLLWIFVPSE